LPEALGLAELAAERAVVLEIAARDLLEVDLAFDGRGDGIGIEGGVLAIHGEVVDLDVARGDHGELGLGLGPQEEQRHADRGAERDRQPDAPVEHAPRANRTALAREEGHADRGQRSVRRRVRTAARGGLRWHGRDRYQRVAEIANGARTPRPPRPAALRAAFRTRPRSSSLTAIEGEAIPRVPRHQKASQARSSVGEHYLDTVGVGGSIPPVPTKELNDLRAPAWSPF